MRKRFIVVFIEIDWMVLLKTTIFSHEDNFIVILCEGVFGLCVGWIGEVAAGVDRAGDILKLSFEVRTTDFEGILFEFLELVEGFILVIV